MALMDAEVQKTRERPPQVRSAVLNHPDLLWQAEIFRLELERRALYERFLRREFARRQPTGDRGRAVLGHLVGLPFRHFLTTNYDTLLEQTLADRGLPFEEFDWTNRRECRDFYLSYLLPDAGRFVVHIHGRADQPGSVVLSHRDYVARYAETAEYVEKLSVLFATLRIVFIGFSLDDPDIRFILRSVNSRFASGDIQHYALLGFSRSNEAQAQIERDRLERQFGIAGIFYDDADGHAALAGVLCRLAAPRPPSEEAKSAPVPKPASAPAVSWNEDPHKGRFGGAPVDPGGTRRLRARLEGERPGGLYRIELVVESLAPPLLMGPVLFYLHPTFPHATIERRSVEGKASLTLEAYGAFTVGVECDGGRTRLELDLCADEGLPVAFRLA
jgi:hypothetical protein